MSTLVQIESAVAGLPPQDQWSLLTWLQKLLSKTPATQAAIPSDRQAWLAELAELRARTHAGKQGVPLQQLMDELREDRC
jgi:hypothetical protein